MIKIKLPFKSVLKILNYYSSNNDIVNLKLSKDKICFDMISKFVTGQLTNINVENERLISIIKIDIKTPLYVSFKDNHLRQLSSLICKYILLEDRSRTELLVIKETKIDDEREQLIIELDWI
jgi:hypothetical protein